MKMLKTLEDPSPLLPAYYERSILKSAEQKKQRLKSSTSSGKSVAQLGQQKNQSCPPLKVYSDTKSVALYGEAAKAQGMSIDEYLNHLQEFADITYVYRYGAPLVKPELVIELPIKMRRLHDWYM